ASRAGVQGGRGRLDLQRPVRRGATRAAPDAEHRPAGLAELGARHGRRAEVSRLYDGRSAGQRARRSSDRVRELWREDHRAAPGRHGGRARTRRATGGRTEDRARGGSRLRPPGAHGATHWEGATLAMMKRDECLKALARHRTDEIVVAVYKAAQEWIHLAPLEL